MIKRVRIVLLGLMIWVVTFIAGGIGFTIFDAEAAEPLNGILLIGGIKALFLAIGLALALYLVYRNKEQDYRRTAWEAGLSWYVIILLLDLVVLVGLIGLKLELLLPSIFSHFVVAIITIVVGYLLAGPKEKV